MRILSHIVCVYLAYVLLLRYEPKIYWSSKFYFSFAPPAFCSPGNWSPRKTRCEFVLSLFSRENEFRGEKDEGIPDLLEVREGVDGGG